MELPRLSPPSPIRHHANTHRLRLSIPKEIPGKEPTSPETISADGNLSSFDEGARTTRSSQSSRIDSRRLAAWPEPLSRTATVEGWPEARYREVPTKPATVETWDNFELEGINPRPLHIDDFHPRAAESMFPDLLRGQASSPLSEENLSFSTCSRSAGVKGFYMCDCCPKKPKKFESQDELRYKLPLDFDIMN
jgi:hypothetical protein